VTGVGIPALLVYLQGALKAVLANSSGLRLRRILN
jgi:hypothetical protein